MTNFDPNMRRKFFSPKIEAENVLTMFLFFGGFQPGCSYKRCSYKKKGVLFCFFFTDSTKIFKMIKVVFHYKIKNYASK